MSRGFVASAGDLQALTTFLEKLNDATGETGISISGAFAIEVSEANLIDAVYDSENGWYAIDEQIGGAE